MVYMETITITLGNNEQRQYQKGVKFSDVVFDINNAYHSDIIAGKFNGRLVKYTDSLNKSGKLYLYDVNTKMGNKIYERGLTFLFTSSAKEVLGKDVKIEIKHSIDKGIYCVFDRSLTIEEVQKIKDVMKDNVSKAIPFTPIETSRMDAIEYFRKIKRFDKVKTLSYNTSDFIKLYKFNGMYNYIIGDLPNDTSVLKYFDLTLIKDRGIVLRFPSIYDNMKVVRYRHHEKYFDTLEEYSQWSKILEIDNLGDLNEKLMTTSPGEMIQLAEIMQDYKLLSIAEGLALNKDNIKLVLISGPSSSGKTTTARKLGLYLKTLGLNPIALSIDDYFIDRKDVPFDEDGKPDYESIRSVDVKLLNEHISKLLNKEKVLMPTYDFIEGKKVFKKTVQLKERDILIIEGLHALNEDLTSSIPKKNKYKIYISPLAYLNIDNDNRISLTDIRLLRRMVRDSRTRGYSSSQTLNTWSSVRKGEEKYVFPYQDEADVILNTFLTYELSVLKTYAEPLLYSITENDPEYLTARRLIEMLKFVLPIPSTDVPATSILREFIGGSFFE